MIILVVHEDVPGVLVDVLLQHQLLQIEQISYRFEDVLLRVRFKDVMEVHLQLLFEDHTTLHGVLHEHLIEGLRLAHPQARLAPRRHDA